MTTYIYMNEQIRKAKPSRPVIVAQDDARALQPIRESNEFILWHHGQRIGRVLFRAEGLPACDTHEVHAWVELDDTVVVQDATAVEPAPAVPTAAEKKPNTPIDFKMKFR